MRDEQFPPLDGQTLESKVNHLYARSEAQSYRTSKNTDSIERIEKTLDRMADVALRQAETLTENTKQLAIHIQRSNHLESLVLEEKKRREAFLPRALQFVSLIAGVLALMKLAL